MWQRMVKVVPRIAKVVKVAAIVLRSVHYAFVKKHALKFAIFCVKIVADFNIFDIRLADSRKINYLLVQKLTILE